MDNSALFKLLDHSNEILRIANIRYLYKHILKDGGTVKLVKKLENNQYRIDICFGVTGDISFITAFLAPTGEYDKGINELYNIIKP